MGMQATTIKLDGRLVSKLKGLMPPDETLSGFVRAILDAEVRRQQQVASAEKYVAFLRTHPEEAEAMNEWAAAPLDRSPKPRKSR